MQGKKAFFTTLALINALALAVCVASGGGVAMAVSFEFAFFATLCIIAVSFLSYKKRIFAQANEVQIPQKPPFILAKKPCKGVKILRFYPADEKLKFSHKFIAFFSLAKLGAYALLAFGFLALKGQNLLSVVAFLGGISAVILSVFIFGVLSVLKYKTARQKV